jgi:hypothetical protein
VTEAEAREIVHRYLLCSQGLLQDPKPHLPSCDAATKAVIEAARLVIDGIAKRTVAAFPKIEPRCTGVAATWCPVCGDCCCEIFENGSPSFDDDDCPLHNARSTHGDNAE